MDKFEELKAEAKSLVDAFNQGTATDEQKSRLVAIGDELKTAKTQMDSAKSAQDLLNALNSGVTEGEGTTYSRGPAVKSLGEAFLSKAGDLGALARRIKSGGVEAPEFKAANTAHTLEGLAFETVTQQVIEEVRPTPTVANLMTNAAMSNPVLKYFRQVPGSTEGAPAITPEGTEKPYVHYKFEQVTAGLSKIAGVTDVTTEMTEDAPFLVSLINSFLVRDLILEEEAQILNGDGAGDNFDGLYHMSGVLNVQGDAGTNLVDAIYRSTTAIRTQSKLVPTGLVIHPIDYENARLDKDGNGQYMGGGPFYAPYGNGTLQFAPSLWGLQTVVTPNAKRGTPLVGDFRQAAILRKGGIVVAASDQHDRNFTQNKVTFRAEERAGLMVQRPAAFAKVSVKSA